MKNKLKEGYLFDFIAQQAMLMSNNTSIQSKFYQWKKENATDVKIVSYKTLDIKKDIDAYLVTHKRLQMKQCYHNAYQVSTILDCEYVEGIGGFSGIPIDHAWNCYKGQHFDLTSEIVLGNVNNFDEYVQLLMLDHYEVMEFAIDLMHSGPYSFAYFMKNIEKKWDKKTIDMLKVIY